MTKVEEELVKAQEMARLLVKFRKSPIFFVQSAFGLAPQTLTCEKEHDHIFKNCYSQFEKNKTLTWQQAQVLQALADGKAGRGSRRISVASGNAIGKSSTAAWATLWFLLCHDGAQITVTSPSQSQLYDVLWKECAVWLEKMPADLRAFFEWQ